MRPKKREIIAHQTLTSHTSSSVKIARSLDDLFMFRDSEKSLKGTPGGSFFIQPLRVRKSDKSILSYILIDLRARERTKTKLGNLFSCIYEHEKEQRLSLGLFLFLRKL
jgi:hypothetical protein